MTDSTAFGPPRPGPLVGRASVVVVAAIALLASVLLYRAQSSAAEIRSKTHRIATSAQGINTYTDSVIKLEETNRLAASILRSVDPLSIPLQDIAGRSDDIADVLRSIRASTAAMQNAPTSIENSVATCGRPVTARPGTPLRSPARTAAGR